MNPNQIAKEIFAVIGSKENIHSSECCMTRLRLELDSLSDDKLAALKKINGVLGVNQTESELQIILGPGRAAEVTKCFQELLKASDSKASETKSAPSFGDGRELHAKIRAKNATPVKLFFKRVADIFIPLIPAFIACGLITGSVNILLRLFPEAASYSSILLLKIAGNTIFYALNIVVGWNASKQFGGTPALGAALAVLISHPLLSSVTLFDSPLVPGRGGIIAVLLISAAASWLEKHVRKFIPEMLDLFMTPLIVFLIAGTLAILILQPVGGIIAEAIGTAAYTAVKSGGALTGFILGGIWLPCVLLGVHQAFTPIHAELLAQTGVTILLPILAMAGSGQVGACAAVYVKTKNHALKKTILSALPVGIMGIGEPLIYGVTLPLVRPFVGACIGGAFGGAVQAAFTVGASTLGLSGLPLAAATDNPSVYLLGIVASYIAGFIATWLIGFADPVEEEEK